MSIDAMKQALEALERSRVFVTTREKIKHPEGTEWYDERITALRTAIEEAEKQEPVAWLYRDSWGTLKLSQIMPPPTEAFPVYTNPPAAQPASVQEPESFEQWNAKQHGDPEEIGFLQALRIAYCAGQDSVTKATPPAAQRQPLPAHEIVTMYEESPTSDSDMIAFARAIEAAHGITGEKPDAA